MDYYVEDHSRIGSISVILEPRSSLIIEESPELTICSSKKIKLAFKQIDIKCDISIELPCPTSLTETESQRVLQRCVTQKLNSNIISIKLPAMINPINDLTRSMNSLMHITYKWSAQYLKSLKSYSINCRECDTVIFSSTKNRNKFTQESIDLKDLEYSVFEMPSESWAELMDFWHCHKPHDHSHESSVVDESKFKLKVPSQSIIIAHYYFAVNLQDFQLFKSLKKDQELLLCTNCDSVLGKWDQLNKFDTVLKWRVVLKHLVKASNKETLVSEKYEPYMFIYFTLLDLMNNSAMRLMEFTCSIEGKDSSLLIWIFNTQVNYTLGRSNHVKSNEQQHTTMASGKQALKVYYTTSPSLIAQERSNRGDQIESQEISQEVYQGTLARLNQINDGLPSCVKSMGDSEWFMSFIGESD